jgi:cell division protein FtsI/penicillin-binding protein 2
VGGPVVERFIENIVRVVNVLVVIVVVVVMVENFVIWYIQIILVVVN